MSHGNFRRRFVLLDANVTAAYYLALSTTNARVRDRIAPIIDCCRTPGGELFLYIPNFCIAETFSVFMKYAYGKWNGHVKKTGTIDKRVYESVVAQFESDIHNGRVITQYELNRYHVLATNHIAPLDHYFRFSRKRKKDNRSPKPMGSFDHLYVGMGIELSRIHGPDNVVLITADDRVSDIVTRCRGGLPKSTIRKVKLHIAEKATGRSFSPELFPVCVNLKWASKVELSKALGSWPVAATTPSHVYRWTRLHKKVTKGSTTSTSDAPP